MNIKGLYSPFRAPKLDQHLHFIFIYPVLIDEFMMKNEAIFRDFISYSFLREALIGNSIDLISSAYRYYDVENKKIHPSMQQTQQISGAQPQPQQTYFGRDYIDPILQGKLSEQTQKIRTYILRDPVISKLRPVMNTVVLRNLAEIPIIVGTKAMPISRNFLFYLILSAYASNKKLNSTENLDYCFSLFKNLQDRDVEKIFNVILNSQENQNFVGRLFSKVKGVLSKYISFKKKENVPTPLSPTMQKTISTDFYEIVSSLRLSKDEIQMNYVLFRKVMDVEALRRDFGLDYTGFNTKFSALISPKVDIIANEILTNYITISSNLSGGILNRFINTISLRHTALNYVDLYDNFVNNVASRLKNYLTSSFSNELKSSLTSITTEKMKTINSLCSLQKDIGAFMEKRLFGYDYYLVSPSSYTNEEFTRFGTELIDITKKASSFIAQFRNLIGKLVSSPTDILSQITTIIVTELEIMTGKYFGEVSNAGFTDVYFLMSGGNQTEYVRWVDWGTRAVALCFQLAICFAIQTAICKLIKEVEIDFEIASNDITTFPNYTLVLPVEIFLIISTISTIRSWKELLKDGRISLNTIKRPIDQSYIKGVIKDINSVVGIPNLIVYDEQKGDVYVKLMTSSDITKIKMSNVSAYINQLKSIA